MRDGGGWRTAEEGYRAEEETSMRVVRGAVEAPLSLGEARTTTGVREILRGVTIRGKVGKKG